VGGLPDLQQNATQKKWCDIGYGGGSHHSNQTKLHFIFNPKTPIRKVDSLISPHAPHIEGDGKFENLRFRLLIIQSFSIPDSKK